MGLAVTCYGFGLGRLEMFGIKINGYDYEPVHLAAWHISDEA